MADRLYDPDVYHLTSQQSSQLSSKLMDLMHSTPWHPLARKHLTTASALAVQARGVLRGKRSRYASAKTSEYSDFMLLCHIVMDSVNGKAI